MAAVKKKTTRKKTHYVRAKKRGVDGGTRARRSVSVVFLLLVLGAIGFGIFSGFRWVGYKLYAGNPRFEIQHLEISSNGRLKEDFIRETTGLREGMNLWDQSFREIEKKLEEVSQIESVSLERRLPHTLIIEVKERMAVARIEGVKKRGLPLRVDRYGFVMPPSIKSKSLPLIKGLDTELLLGEAVGVTDVETALKIIGICESSGYLRTYIQIETLDLKYSDFIDMRLHGDIRVRMPRFSLKPKLQNLATLIKIANGQGQRVKEVDLTLDSAKVPVTYY
ncbi:cell division protein FtsQ/DivIB [Pontiella agarivorans]|uniref:FtsQ-type POTRA domain-containing protein n=1 Tax=Pontiella agarivorans TaxID=3038953 RepID=A0ABU5MUH4_9BACT|nr:FtsQ-type POTRA domain-containing protein [Pontiella agarivorans]MDZ8117864.1 FtsQ-type POTRA domain-containing protein [Pontiella agarivorans]